MLKPAPALLLLLLAPALASTEQAKQPATTQPALVVRVASLDSAFDHLKIVGSLIGQDNLANDLDQAIKSKLGVKGLHAVSGKRPIGFYGNLSAGMNDSSGVLMVPIVGANQFKAMLEQLGWEIAVDKTGLHTVKQRQFAVDVQYRVSGDYAYVGLGAPGMLAPAALLTPQAVFGAKPSGAAVAATVRLGQVPEPVRVAMLDGFKQGLGKVDDKTADNMIQKLLAAALASEATRMVETALKDGEELNLQFDIAPKTRLLSVDLTLSARAKSPLADQIAKLGQRQTLFAGVMDKNAAMNSLINLEVPAELKTALASVMKEVSDKVLSDLTDPAMKKQAADLLDALAPSFTADDLDLALSMRGPSKSKQFTFVAGFKLKQGEKLAATLLEMVKGLPGSDQKMIQLGADKVGTVPIHRIDLQASLDAKTKELVGEQPLWVALRDNALFLAIGEEALAAIKQALAAAPAPAAGLRLDLAMARFAALDSNEAKAKAAQALLQAGDDAPVHLEVRGGTALRMRFTMALSALQLSNQEK